MIFHSCSKAPISSGDHHDLRRFLSLRYMALGCVLLGPAAVVPVHAETAPSVVADESPRQDTAGRQKAQEREHSSARMYQLKPGPLGQVLSEFARQSNVVLSFPSHLTDGMHSDGLQGHYAVPQGFAALLSGSGLRAVKQTQDGEVQGADVQNGEVQGNYVLRPSPQTRTVELDAMRVQGRRLNHDGYLAHSGTAVTKTDTPLMETAQSISVVTEDQISDRQALSVSQAVAYAAGVRVEGSGLDPRFDSISLRGYPVVYNGDFLDGLRQPNTDWLSYYATQPYNLERIEVVKGPDSVLYGQLSPGGLVNRVSKRPRQEARQEVQVQLGSHDHRQGQFDVGGALNDALQYRLVGLRRDAQTDIEQVDNDATLLAPTLRWQISERTDITLISQYQERETSASPRPYQRGEKLTHFWAGDEDFDKLDQHQWALGYELNHAFNDRWSLQQNVRYGEVDTTNQYLSAGTLSGTTLSRSSVALEEDMESLSTDTRLMATLQQGEMRHQLLMGVDYAYLTHDVTYAGGEAPSIDLEHPDYHQPIPHPDDMWTDDHGKTHRAGVYLQDQLSIDQWRLTAGVRRDWARDETQDHLAGETTQRRDAKTTGRFGALYVYDFGLSPYFSYSQSFVPETGADASGHDFEPTEGEQFELGVKYQPPGTEARFTAAVYQITESHRKTTDLEHPLFQTQTGEVRTRGLELEAVGDLTDDLRMTASYNFNQAEITRDNEGDQGHDLANTPRHLASLWLDYAVPWIERLHVSGGVRYIGTEYIDNANSDKNEAYRLVDLAARYDFGGRLDGVRLSLNATNIADEAHISCEGPYCYRGAGRSLIGSLAYRW